MEQNRIYYELVGERNRMNSEVHELLQLLGYKEKEMEHLDRLIKIERENRKVAIS